MLSSVPCGLLWPPERWKLRQVSGSPGGLGGCTDDHDALHCQGPGEAVPGGAVLPGPGDQAQSPMDGCGRGGSFIMKSLLYVKQSLEEGYQILEKLSLIEKEREGLEGSSSLLGFAIETLRKGLQEEESKHLEKLN